MQPQLWAAMHKIRTGEYVSCSFKEMAGYDAKVCPSTLKPKA